MNVCIDVGNTTIVIGIYKNDSLFTIFKMSTKNFNEFEKTITQALDEYRLNMFDIDNVIYSSVVPEVDSHIIESCQKAFRRTPIVVTSSIKHDVPLLVDNPQELGYDLLADLVAAKEKYGYPCLICDLGTASKVLLLDKEGNFVSCLILPGMSLSLKALTANASLLADMKLYEPKTIMAKNTSDALNSGILYGHADEINGLCSRYEKELGYECKRILTGGASYHIKDLLNGFIYDQSLCLDGLNILIRKNGGSYEK